MESINSYLTLNIWPIVNLLLAGLLLYVILYLGDRIVNASKGKSKTLKLLAGRWSLIERSLWAIFLLVLVGSLIKSNPIVGSVIAGILVVSLWPFLRNFLSGLVFQFSGKYKPGQSVRIDGDEGTITGMGAFACELTLATSAHDIMQIPYRHLTETRITQTSPSVNSVSAAVDFIIPKSGSVLLAENQIQKELHNNSWLLMEDKHPIELVKELDTERHFRVLIHALDTNHLQRAKDQLTNFKFEEN